MGYQITYDGIEIHVNSQQSTPWRAQLLVAAALLVCFLLVRKVVPGAVEVMAALFLPGEGTATEVMAEVVAEGGTLRDGLIAFCRNILLASGYET